MATDDLRRAIAFLFKRRGRDELSEKEFVLSASMDLRWFPPKDAQRLLQAGLETKLLDAEAGMIRPTFDPASVEVPRSFSPTTNMLEVPRATPEDVFLKVVEAITVHTKSDRRTVIASINAIQERMDLDFEIAALFAARKAGLDVAPFLPAVRTRLGLE